MARQSSACDVLVVGARIAGSLTAGFFAARGHRVVVVDKARFPSHTLSTHFFRGAGLLHVLAQLGWLDDVLATGAPPLTCEYNYEAGDVVPTVGPPQEPGSIGYCLSVRREALDATLLNCLGRSAAVDLVTGCAVKDVIRDQERIVGATLADGSVIRARLVVGADGRRSRIAACVAPSERERHPGYRATYYRYVRDFAPPSGQTSDGPEFFLLGDQMAYVFPSDDGVTCIALSLNRADFEGFRHDVIAGWEQALQRHPGLWPRYAASAPCGRVMGTAPQVDYVRQAAGPGWALVGDSAIHQDPWSGAGMDSAAIQASLLADVASDAWTHGSDDWAKTYERRRDAALLDGFHETVEGARDLSVLGKFDEPS